MSGSLETGDCDGTNPALRSRSSRSSWPRSTMDSIRASEAPDTGSIPVEATLLIFEAPDTGSLPDSSVRRGIPVEAKGATFRCSPKIT